MNIELNAILTIAFRDVTKLLRDKTRLLASFVFPLIFVAVLGTSLELNLGPSVGFHFITFVFVGVLAQTMFQSPASGLISLLEDRQTDFAQELFVSPISRYSIIIGKIVGETMVAFVQVIALFGLASFMDINLSLPMLLKLLPACILIAFMGGSFGVLIMSNISDQKKANQIFPFIMFPQFFLAGVFNPIQNLPLPIFIASRIAPMTYAVDFLRSIYYQGSSEAYSTVIYSIPVNLVVIILFTLSFILLGTYSFIRNERNL